MKLLLALVATVALLQGTQAQSNIIEVAQTLGLSTLKSFLDQASLTDTLAGTAGSPFTVFAPTNDAFDALPQDIKDAIAADVTLLGNVLKYHVIGGAKVMSTDLANDLTADSLYTGNKIRINIYGSTVLATGSQVTNPDQEASNGVIHVISKVMLPPDYNVVEYAQNNGAFSNLTDLVIRAGLVDALSGGNLTVFAPTNAAFAQVPASLLNELLADNDKLIKVLTYHVVSGTTYSQGLSNGQTLNTLNTDGEPLKVTINNDGVKINDAMVAIPNVSVKNGVIHAIDKVLVPDLGPTDAAWGVQPSLLMTTFTLALIAMLHRL